MSDTLVDIRSRREALERRLAELNSTMTPVLTATDSTPAPVSADTPAGLRTTADFPPHIQAMLKQPINLGGVSVPCTDTDICFSSLDDFAEGIPPGPPSASRHDNNELDSSLSKSPSGSHTSTESTGSTVSDNTAGDRRTVVLLTSNIEPALVDQMSAVLKGFSGMICTIGWQCWKTHSCGGSFIEGDDVFHHRSIILAKDPVHQRQYAICLSFLRQCPTAAPNEGLTNSLAFMRALDIYVQSGFERHLCWPAPVSTPQAREALKQLDRSSLSIPHGIFLLAAIYLQVVANVNYITGWVGPGLLLSLRAPSELSYVAHSSQTTTSPIPIRINSSPNLATSPRDELNRAKSPGKLDGSSSISRLRQRTVTLISSLGSPTTTSKENKEQQQLTWQAVLTETMSTPPPDPDKV